MWRATWRWTAEAGAVFAKEWRCEARTRYALGTVVLFALATLVTVSLALGPLGVTGAERDVVLPALLWLILLFAAAAGLPRSFVHEQDRQTAVALRLAATPSALFCGKTLFSLTLLLGLQLVVVPAFLALMQLSVASPGTLLVALVAGGYGLAVASTLIASIVAQARARGALFAALAFPALIPLLVMAVELTAEALAGGGGAVVVGQLVLYDAAVTVAGLMLFPTVWNP